MLWRIEVKRYRMNSKLKNLRWNSILALCYQAVLIVTGLLLPRFFLRFYGSEVNGLITSINQFLAFINICDLGISAVVSSAYYKPLADGDTHQISKVFVYSKRFFKSIGIILCAYIVFLLIVYPTWINNSFDYWFTFTLIVAMSISQLGQYFIGISYQLLLNADQKSYVQLSVNGATLLCNTVISILLMFVGANIQIVKLTTSLIYLLRPILMCIYVKKHYAINQTVTVDASVVTQKKNGIIQHIAYMVYENTDIMVLTLFSTLENVSIYAIYTMVTNSIKQIITAAITGVQALLGNLIAEKQQENLTKFYSFYSWGFHTISALLFTITGLLIIPFVSVYTSNIEDADYYTPVFAILITLVYYLSSIRNCNYVLIRAAGHYKQTQWASLLEAALNLIISIICVFHLGLVGVAIGTSIATLFFVIYEIVYFSKNIVFLPIRHFIKQVIVEFISVGISISIAVHVDVFTGSLISWLLQAVIISLICCFACLLSQMIFYRDNLSMIKTSIIKKSKGDMNDK